jgi:proline-specific peptidase
LSASLHTSDGRKLTYAVVSDGSPQTLVCHPGGPGLSGAYFGRLAGVGAGELRVVTLNPRGTGGSSQPPDGSYELEDYAEDLDQLRAHLGLEQFDLLGHSHGGFVGMVYALRYPGRLRRLVLLCTAPRFSEELREESERAREAHRGHPWFEDSMQALERRQAGDFESPEEAAALYAREARLWFAPEAVPAAEGFLEEFGQNRPDLNALGYFNTRLAPSYDMRPQLREIAVETLVLNGAADFFGPRISARELEAIPDARVVLLPDSGHFPFVDQPERFRQEVETFLLA